MNFSSPFGRLEAKLGLIAV